MKPATRIFITITIISLIIVIIINLITSCAKPSEFGEYSPMQSIDTTKMFRHYQVGDTMTVDASLSEFEPGHPFGSLMILKWNFPHDTIWSDQLVGYWIFNSPGKYTFKIQVKEREPRCWGSSYYEWITYVKN